MIATSAHPALPSRIKSSQGMVATALVGGAMAAAAYLAGVHLAASAGDDGPGGVEAGATLGPSCVGCHQGADDDPPDGGPGPEGALAGATRDELARRHGSWEREGGQ